MVDTVDIVSQIMDYEAGEMSDDQVVEFFQGLINSGMCWHLQGSYQRTATQLINQGLCTRG